VDEDLEPGRVARQLEEAHDADDAEELEDVVVDVHVVEDAVDEERQRRHDVDDVDRAPDEVQPLRADDQPDEDLEREPRVADRLHVEEGLVRLRRLVDEAPDGPVAGHLRLVGDHRHAQVRVRLEAERQNRYDDEEHGNERNYLKQSQKNRTSNSKLLSVILDGCILLAALLPSSWSSLLLLLLLLLRFLFSVYIKAFFFVDE